MAVRRGSAVTVLITVSLVGGAFSVSSGLDSFYKGVVNENEYY